MRVHSSHDPDSGVRTSGVSDGSSSKAMLEGKVSMDDMIL